MKVLQIIPSLSSGGAEKFVTNLCNSLNRDGHDVHIALMFYDEEKYLFNKTFLEDNIKIHYVNPKAGYLRVLISFFSLVKQIKPDCIHCHLAVLQYLLLVYLFRPGINIIHTLHSLTQYASGDNRFKSVLYKFLYSHNIVKPVTISNECHLSYVDYYKLRNDTLIENGCPQSKCTAAFPSVKKQIESIKKSPLTKIFIHVARYHEAKNQTMLIDAFNVLDKQSIDYILLIVGSGFDTPEAEDLVKSANKKIVFLGEKKNVSDYLLVADAFCMTSIYEGLPISLIEALSCGLVPICTKVGGIKNVLQEGVNGYLAESRDIASYVSAIHRFLENNIEPSILISEFNKYYSIDNCMGKYLNLYRQKNEK